MVWKRAKERLGNVHGGAGNAEPTACIFLAVSTWKSPLLCALLGVPLRKNSPQAPCDRTEHEGGVGGHFKRQLPVNVAPTCVARCVCTRFPHTLAARVALLREAMVSELEGLLKAAARIAAEETGTGIIHVIVNGDNDKGYLLDTAAGTLHQTGVGDDEADELALAVEESRAKVHLTYASEDVFLGLAHK